MDETLSGTKDGDKSEDTEVPVTENKPEVPSASLTPDSVSKENKAEETPQPSRDVTTETNNSQITKVGVSERKGEAKIKAQYLLIDYKPQIDPDFVTKETQKALKHLNDGNTDNSSLEPAPKRLRLKGRNKKRPFEKKQKACQKLCSSLIQEKECIYGTKCIFQHDVKAFWESKPEDIGPKCHLFTKFGKCPYSYSCRFARHHISETLENMVNKDIYQATPSSSSSSLSKNSVNHLNKDVQKLLWKKKYDFSKSERAVAEMMKKSNSNNSSNNSASGNNRLQTGGAKLDTDSSGQNIGLASDEDPIKLRPAEKLDTDPSNQNIGLASDEDLVKLKPAEKLDTDPSNKNIGLASDEDLVKLRPAEKLDEDLVKLRPAEKLDADPSSQNIGFVSDADLIKLRPVEKKIIDFSNKLYLAPLTTVGNLPFRRLCKSYGADITCSEMAVATSVLQGKTEWALLKRHESEDIFGIQLCGSHIDSMSRCAQLIQENCQFDFVDINCGCPIELVYQKGEGCALMGRPTRLEQIIKALKTVLEVPLTVKMRTGIQDGKNIAHTLIPKLTKLGVDLITVHGRSREQHYTKLADWDYIDQCSQAAMDVPLFGNGDVLSFEDANNFLSNSQAKGVMIARGALIKPWIFTEIKEQRHWDISSSERLDMLREFVRNGFEHWGSDHQGVETTRRFLLEMLSFSHRYIPVGVLERVPQKINERPPYYVARDDLETMMSSSNCRDWIKISEMLLGPVTENFLFLPKHKANAYK